MTWLLDDVQGTASITVNAATAATTRQYYTPYGNQRGGNLIQGTTDRAFLGRVEDYGTGLVQDGARYYDPTIGHFISPDALNDGSAGQLNAYGYATDNPVSIMDPSGLRNEYLYYNANGNNTGTDAPVALQNASIAADKAAKAAAAKAAAAKAAAAAAAAKARAAKAAKSSSCGWTCKLKKAASGSAKWAYDHTTVGFQVCIVACLGVNLQGGHAQIQTSEFSVTRLFKNPGSFLSTASLYGGITFGFNQAKVTDTTNLQAGGCFMDGIGGCVGTGIDNTTPGKAKFYPYASGGLGEGWQTSFGLVQTRHDFDLVADFKTAWDLLYPTP